MSKLRRRLRDLTFAMYLWGQRFRWPFPAAIRSAVRRVLARTVDRATPAGADEWPHLPVPCGRASDTVRLPTNDQACRAAGISSTTRRNPLWPDAHPRLRCMVATGTLDLGGLEIVALFLARGLPSHGLDTIVAHA